MALYPVTHPETRTSGVDTTNATATKIQAFPTRKSEVVTVKTWISCRRTGGSGGSSTDGGTYELLGSFVNDAGTLYQIGNTVKVASEAESTWDADFSISDGVNVRVMVTGEASVNISWTAHSMVIRRK